MGIETKLIDLTVSQFKVEGDSGSFRGYASTFGNVDSYGDTIIKGAYLETLNKYGLPKMFFNHDKWSVPPGKWIKAEEDDYGLLLTGEFTPGNAQAEQLKAALKHGTIDGISIGYALKKGDYQETATGRVIHKVARLPESSLVTFPADSFARVDPESIKASADDIAQLETIRDFEYFLRDAGGFSKGAAQALTARAKMLFGERDAAGAIDAKTGAELLARLNKLAA